jgi:hypothetical protein
MSRWVWRIKLLAVAMLAVGGSLRAQDGGMGCPCQAGPNADRPVIAGMADRYDVEHPDPYGSDPKVYSPNQEPCRAPQPVADFFRKINIGCWSHHNCYTCGTLVSEGRFIFGSCKAFYGEACMRGPRDLPVPIGMYGYGPMREGCGCQ